MADWKNATKGPDYTGPTDATLMQVITAFGTQPGCTLTHLLKHVGPGTANWPETLTDKLNRLVSEGKLLKRELIQDVYYEKKD